MYRRSYSSSSPVFWVNLRRAAPEGARRPFFTSCAWLLATFTTLAALSGCSAVPQAADPNSDAPEAAFALRGPFIDAPTYDEALQRWQSPEDINAWIGARFRYDTDRAMQLSETQRQASGRMPILAPDAFFAAPRGVCVDVARFALETLRTLQPGVQPRYLMIEFDPVSVRGNTLRRHWLVSFERGGQHYFFADSKRPGHIAGPYASVQAFVDEYAHYRGRRIVAFSERESYERRLRTRAVAEPAS